MSRPASEPRYCRVIVDVGPAHLDRPFDYRCDDHPDVGVGTRVRVPFNGRLRTAWVTAAGVSPATDAARIKPLDRVEGPTVWFDDVDLKVWRWLADRYAGTMSGAIRHALPARVVRVENEAAGWGTTAVGQDANTADASAVVATSMAPFDWTPFAGAQDLLDDIARPGGGAYHLRVPLQPIAGEGPALADLVRRSVAAGYSAIVVAPSGAPGPADDVVQAMGLRAADLRGTHDDAERYRAFLRLRRGDIDVVVGERSVALLPLPRLGLTVVIDEANPAYKERRNPRHHVRDTMLGRARIGDAVAVLTSSVLSAHARRHASGGHLRLIRADRETERRSSPSVTVVDRTALPPAARRSRMAAPVSRRIDEVVSRAGRIIVLAAAKGSGSSLACVRCRSRHECPNCGAGVSAVTDRIAAPEMWRCATCGWDGGARSCLDCGADETFPLRAGAKRLAAELAKTHPDAAVAHMEGFDQPGPTSVPAIAVMTRGSVVARPDWMVDPGGLLKPVDLLIVADPDVLIGRPDVEASEDAARLWFDAARLARQVIIQTAEPEQHAIQALVRMDPDGFWASEEPRRADLSFPPAGSIIRFTSLPVSEARHMAQVVPGTVLGPDPDGVALLMTTTLHATLEALRPLRQKWARDDVRIRVDVDPVNIQP